MIEDFFQLPHSYGHKCLVATFIPFFITVANWQKDLEKGSVTLGQWFEGTDHGGAEAMVAGTRGSWPECICRQEEERWKLELSLLSPLMGCFHTQLGWGFLPQFTQSRSSLTDVPST